MFNSQQYPCSGSNIFYSFKVFNFDRNVKFSLEKIINFQKEDF